MFSRQPDTIAAMVLDSAMPGMDSAEVARRSLALRPRLPILVSSDFRSEEIARCFAALPVAAFVRTPFSAAALLKGIAEALE